LSPFKKGEGEARGILKITPKEITKKLEKFLENQQKSSTTSWSPSFKKEDIICSITNFRPLEEAKVSSGGVDMNEIKPNFECKNVPNLYFI
jgi:predicted flavoprotein YhiN